VSRRLKKRLVAAGFEVRLTRDDDRYLGLEERAQLANRWEGDLFLSIHCNSARSPRLHGVETYSLNVSSDRYAMRLAARENAASEKQLSDLELILADLATKANTEESALLAERVQAEVVAGLSRRYSNVVDLGRKQALFYVLLGARMPAVLVETSFLSHPLEEQRLGSVDYQEALAGAIAAGVLSFVGDRGSVASSTTE
jgi:N-acetylmuramoyl-L-alanine amidase